jgi:hypothetical protein
MIVVIDALDECDIEVEARLIISFLPQSKSLASVRLELFVTSRRAPDPPWLSSKPVAAKQTGS